MFNHILKFMYFSVLAKVLCLLFCMQFSSSKPVNDTDNIESLYSLFLREMTNKSCALPNEVQLPFSSKVTGFEAFSSSLYPCRKVEYLIFNQEASVLCHEIFGFLRNISCLPKTFSLPQIKIDLSSDVCKDFALNKAVLPEGLMQHLSDNFNCNLMCKDEFAEPCQILLWSFLVQLQVKSTIENSQKLTEVSDTPLTENKQEQSQKPIAEESKESKIIQKNQIDQRFNNNPVQITGKEADPTVEKLPSLGKNVQLLEADHQEVNHLTDNIQVTKTKTTKISNAVEVVKTTESAGINVKANEVEKLNPDINSQSENVHGKANDVEELPDTGIPKVENDPGSDVNAQQKDETGDLVNAHADAKDNQVSVTSNYTKQLIPDINDPAKENELEQKQHVSIGDATAQNTHDAQIQTIPGFKAAYGINIAQTVQNTSTKKDEMPSITMTEVLKIPTEPSVIKKKPVPDAMSIASDNTSPVPVISSTAVLEKMEDDIPLPGDKDLDQYNDLDNNDGDIDGEYNKQDYDGTVYEPSKNKESNTETPSAVNIPKEPSINQKDDSKGFSGYPSRDSFGRGSDEIQVIASFPEQEDSHFFFYFLSIVLILMAGYLIFHNKQKIIALIVEGRHERRRRSHGLGYKKLETK